MSKAMPRAPLARRPWARWGVLLGLAGLGCAMDLPDPNLIVTTRALALRTVVVGALVEDDLPPGVTRAQALPLETVRIEPFLVGPDGPVDPSEIDPVWIACQLVPGVGLFGCLSAAFPLSLDDIPACPEIDPFELDPEMPPAVPSPCVIGTDPVPDYVVPFSTNVLIGGSVEVTMIGSTPGGTSTSRCASELLEGGKLDNDCIFAVQRIDIGPIERMLLLLDELGIVIEGLEPPDDPDSIPQADHNPRISEFKVTVLDADGEELGEAQDVELGGLVEVELGQRLRVDVVSPEDDLQTYEIPVNNGQDFEQRDEAYSGDWFRSWGGLLSGTSDDPESFNEWVFQKGDQDETEAPPDGRAFLYYTVRDGRQGVNWWWFEVEVSEP